MFSSPILRALNSGTDPKPEVYINPYKAKKAWPPDFSKLTQKHQFRLERRYRRRAKLAWARPRWMKATKMVQLGLTIVVIVYGVLFQDWQQENKPFDGVRKWFFGQTGSIWSRNPERVQRREQPDGTSNAAKE